MDVSSSASRHTRLTAETTTPGYLTITASGNSLLGTSSTTTTGTHSNSLVETGSNSGGAYSVTQTSSASPLVNETDNSITGDYTLTETGVQSYLYDQKNGPDANANSFSAHETGSNYISLTKGGNALSGSYSQTLYNSDNSMLTQTGSKTETGMGGNLVYTQTLIAYDSSTVIELGNSRSGDFQRTTTGALPNATILETGTDRGTPFSNPRYVSSAYGGSESGNYATNTFNQTKSGADRYSLMEQTNDTSSVNGNNGPGELDSSPSGAPLIIHGIPVSFLIGAVLGGLPDNAPSGSGQGASKSGDIAVSSLGLSNVPSWITTTTVNNRTAKMLLQAEESIKRGYGRSVAQGELDAARQAYTDARNVTFQDADFREHQKVVQSYAANPTNPVGQAYKIRNDAIDGLILGDLRSDPAKMRAYVDDVGRRFGPERAREVGANPNPRLIDPGKRADMEFWFDFEGMAAAGVAIGMASEFQGARRGLTAGQAGRFADLKRLAVVGDEITPHHMPQAALRFTSYADGGAIALPYQEHVLTRTYLSRGAQLAQQEAGANFRIVLGRDLRDLRGIAGNKYDPGIRDLLDYYRKEFPELIARPILRD